jgi:hypothetical protein
MSDFYILRNKVPVPATLLEWASWYEKAERIVSQEEIKGVRVSTVFLGVDHGFFRGGLPVLFETMIFGGKHVGHQARSCTWHEAEEEHTKAWDLVAGIKVDA